MNLLVRLVLILQRLYAHCVLRFPAMAKLPHRFICESMSSLTVNVDTCLSVFLPREGLLTYPNCTPVSADSRPPFIFNDKGPQKQKGSCCNF